MCNDYRNRIPLDTLRDGFPGLETPGGAPNLEPRDDVRITKSAPVIRNTAAGGRELAQLRWSWPGPGRAASRSTISAPTGGGFRPADA